MKISSNILICLIIGIIGCKQNSTETKAKTEIEAEPIVISFDDKPAFADFTKLNLDDKCVNLLDPRNTPAAERESVVNAWSTFHKKVNTYLTEQNFSWEVPDSTIRIYNRIYFDKNGNVNYYVFNINTPSVSEAKKAEFQRLLKMFSKDVQLGLKREEQYAQCGSIKYLNY